MSASKATMPLVATMMVLLMGVILYPQGLQMLTRIVRNP
jgi:hypothetical protein